MKKVYILIFAAMFFFFTTKAQNSIIEGTLFSLETGQKEPMPFVNILIEGTSIGTTTNFEGNFKLSVKEGSYTIIIKFIGYVSEKLYITTSPSKPIYINLELKPNNELLDAVEIFAKVNKESKASEILEMKNSNGVDNVISSESMAEKNVSNVSDATKKMVGISVVGSKYVFVRGMGDRYNSAYLNGLPLPSPDPDNEVIPLDIFPSSVVQSISVKKAFTPELYGDFAGGAIDIRTKSYPEKPTFNVSLGSSINTQSTFKNFKTYNGGKNDKWGFEDGTRSMPLDVQNSNYYSATSTDSDGNTQGFEHSFNPLNINAPINTSFGIFSGNKFILGKDKELGVLFLANYSNKSVYENGQYRIINAQDETQVDYLFDKWKYITKGSVLGNIYLKFNDENNIQFNTLFVNSSSDEVRETKGFNWDYVHNVFSRRLTYKQNNLLANQLIGNHKLLNDKIEFSWEELLILQKV